jgi:hypothetical protein
VIDCSVYKEDDYIVPLSQKHFNQDKVQAVKWWERKVPAGRSQSVGQSGLRGLKPIEVKKKQKKKSDEEKTVTADHLFRWFIKAGNIDRPDMGIPLVPIEKVLSLRKFVEE